MSWLITVAVIFLWLLLLGALYLQGRFHYSRRSRLVLAAEAPAAVLAAAAAVRAVFRGLSGWPLAAAVGTAALPTYIAGALVTVEVWRRLKLRRFDEHIGALRTGVARATDELERLETAGGAAAPAPLAPRRPAPTKPDAAPRDREILDHWLEQDGSTRVRGVLAAEWEREFGGLPAGELESALRALEDELGLVVIGRRDGTPGAATGEERRERAAALRARLAVGRLELARRGRTEAAAATGTAPAAGRRPAPADAGLADAGLAGAGPAGAGPARRREELRAQVAEARETLAEWQRRRSEFLRGRILLD